MKKIRVIVFKIAKYWLALPMTVVLNVRDFPSNIRESSRDNRLIHLDNRTLTLLPLKPILVKPTKAKLPISQGLGETAAVTKSPIDLSNVGEFLIIVKTPGGDACAIPVERLPTMIDLPLSTIRKLPDYYSETYLLGMANYVAVWQYEAEKLTIFLLDLERALSVAIGYSSGSRERCDPWRI
ncbi:MULTISPECIES: hypothetical protein [Moorena]|uniref:hypothetical protein n=1 Tax=Moorena TaxID=1155738 RepID=UPI0012B52FFA|nr:MULTISPECIES: hypothetical protein [Moorena]NEP32435.1 hypothetical protein [Moorena sp. SIO3B2]NEP67970.1 hypothetical protein [Moorena sp. SIO3A5]NEQ18537.1 hypothetical protein [Moorena sp. SIO3E2]NER90099.1 hypothetical protein [Moorena sp. SIO3A2]